MAHENLTREEKVESSSDRGFGVVFTCVFLIIAAWPLLHGAQVRWWAVAIAAAFALTTIIKPTLLAPLNRLWTAFGLLLGKIVAPIALAVLFYLVLAPIGLILRLTGKDPLRLKRDPDAESYWISRTPPGPSPDSMTNQF